MTDHLKVYTKVIILLLIMGSLSLPGNSQVHNAINLGQIPQRKVRKYIISRSIDLMPDFSSIQASWKKNTDESLFHVMKNVFYVNSSLPEVWAGYRHANPVKIWNGRLVRFGLLISKYSNSVKYINSNPFPEIDTGQVYFLDLKLIKGLFNVPLAFEIVNIDVERNILEFSYIDKNISSGKQTLGFFDNGDGRTRIIHTSYFKSGSSLRDGLFYPFFHRKFIRDFHRNMAKLLNSSGSVYTVIN